MNWEKLKLQLDQNSKISILNVFANCEKLQSTIPKYPKLQSIVPILNLWKKWEKFYPNLRFTAENKICKYVNMQRAGHILNLTWWMRHSISSNFKSLSMICVKYVFHWQKWNFEPIGIFVHTTEKAPLILLLLYLQMLIMGLGSLLSSLTVFHFFHERQHLSYLVLKCFNCSNSLVPFHFLLQQFIRRKRGEGGGTCGTSSYRNPVRKFVKFLFPEQIKWKTLSRAKLRNKFNSGSNK